MKRAMVQATKRAIAMATKSAMADNSDNMGNGYSIEGGRRLAAAMMGTARRTRPLDTNNFLPM
jgi:hypothetical protein